jgi:hypothetical protein
MGCRNGSAILVGQEHGQTVRDQYRAGQPELGGYRRIGHSRPVGWAVLAVQVQHRSAVHLSQDHGPGAQCVGVTAEVLRNSLRGIRRSTVC